MQTKNQTKQKQNSYHILTSDVRPVFLSLNGENVHVILWFKKNGKQFLEQQPNCEQPSYSTGMV